MAKSLPVGICEFRKIVERYGGFTDSNLDDLFGALQRRDIEDFNTVSL